MHKTCSWVLICYFDLDINTLQVLDEIHRQPVSLSLSMVSLPAPESIVNSLPAKSYKKLDAAGIGDDIEQ